MLMTRVRLASLALVAAALTLLGACGGDDDAPDLSAADVEAILDASAARMEALESFHFEVEHENGSTPILGGIGMESASGDVVGTDRMRLEVEARVAATNIRTTIVILPGTDYFQNPLTGRWEEQEIDVSDIFDPVTGVSGLMRAARDVTAVDQEDVEGVDSYVLEATVDSGDLDVFVSGATPGRPVTARVWVGVEDSLVRRIEVRGPIAPDDDESIVRRLHLSAFDEPVEITAPE